MEDKRQKYEGHLLLFNVSKPKNMGTLIRSAAAFNFQTVFTVLKTERDKELRFNQIQKKMGFFGSQGTAKQMNFQNFQSLKEAKEYFNNNNITVCGVEITETSQSVINRPFKGSTVFFMGNEGQGINECHKHICDQFIYIPQYSEKTASLNVSIAGSIIFHHFAIWAGFEEQQIFGEKFKKLKTDDNTQKVEEQQIFGEKFKKFNTDDNTQKDSNIDNNQNEKE